MESIQNFSRESDKRQFIKANKCDPKTYRNFSHTVGVFTVLQSLREGNVLCDVRLETDDGKQLFGHEVVLVSASLYFREMFTSRNESNKDLINVRELNSTILKLLVDYIYTGEITVTEKNVQDLLPAAKLLQLEYVKKACVEFLQTQLDPMNCLGIKAFADLHNCMELLSSSETYIKKQFVDVVKGVEFLSLSTEEVIKLISSNDLNVPFEEKVYECVINWVKHALNVRYDSLPKLMEHVRLPLASLEYISINVVEDFLLKNSPKCKDYVIEAFQFHALKSQQLITIPQTIRNTPRQSGQKDILLFSDLSRTHWHDPTAYLWQVLPNISIESFSVALALIKERFVFSLGYLFSSRSVNMLDLSSQSPCWVSTVNMLVGRRSLGVGVLDDRLYAVGGINGADYLNSVEVFDMSIKEWRMVSSMSIERSDLGVGVLNNVLYAIGGYDGFFNHSALKSVESYDPSLDTWTPIADMSVCRYGVGVGVLDGVMYAVGGKNESEVLKLVEAYIPNSGVWTSIADMHLSRYKPETFVSRGVLYVMGGSDGSTYLDSVEIYNPNTNTWSIGLSSKFLCQMLCGIVVDKPPNCIYNFK